MQLGLIWLCSSAVNTIPDFVSEIEFVPSLYLDTVDHLFIDKKLAEQMMRIVEEITPKKKVKLKMKV